MEFVQTHSRETETSLLHIPPQCSQKDLITGIDNRFQTVEFRTGQGLTDGVVDKSNLLCAEAEDHSDLTIISKLSYYYVAIIRYYCSATKGNNSV